MKQYTNHELSMLMIQHNNEAVTKLRGGKVIEAFHLLSKACRAVHELQQQQNKDNGYSANADNDCQEDHHQYQYTWLDCSKAVAHRMKGTRNFCEGSLPFLFLQFLWIDTPMESSSSCYDSMMMDEMKDDGPVCVRGFVWVLWYNLATVSILVGSPVGATGNCLLQQSLELFRSVQSAVDPEPLSKHWIILKLAILNNEACALSELNQSRQRLDRLVKMGLALCNMSDLLEPEEQELFLWTVTSMADDRFAAAA
ncbi:unnamed protein product [Cylindrotheca closterium]|uniref:Uncharacterized protein n=1 Tax=Cylindrotheca closterium TaxID=2856 RepID=A0AAD2FYK1_9STRA|nr:unnamed protein product [Cylindrotheca closterium]